MIKLDDELQEEMRTVVNAFLKAKTAAEFSALLDVEHDLGQQVIYEMLAAVHNDGFERGKDHLWREYFNGGR
jgi:hypothetical protein